MLYDEMTLRELEMLVFIYQKPRNVQELSDFLNVAVAAVNIYTHRLRKRGYIETDRSQKEVIHALSDKGRNIIIKLRADVAR